MLRMGSDPHHVHLLLRTGLTPISTVMRRLLTGYAGQFNRRHGHLFQNRYKSILCQEETYLKEFGYSAGPQCVVLFCVTGPWHQHLGTCQEAWCFSTHRQPIGQTRGNDRQRKGAKVDGMIDRSIYKYPYASRCTFSVKASGGQY